MRNGIEHGGFYCAAKVILTILPQKKSTDELKRMHSIYTDPRPPSPQNETNKAINNLVLLYRLPVPLK